MDRKTLLSAVETVAPAIVNKSFGNPRWGSFHFDGREVSAFNGAIAISCPCQTEWVGDVPSNPFLPWLRQVSGNEIVLSADKDKMTLKAGAAKLKTPMLADDSPLFTWPDYKKESSFQLHCSLAFVQAIKEASLAMEESTTKAWQTGIALVCNGKRVILYSNCNLIVSRVLAAVTEIKTEPIVLGSAFCNLVSKMDEPDTLSINVEKDWAILSTHKGARLYGSLIAGPHSMEEYTNVFDKAAAMVKAVPPIDVPKQFIESLKQVSYIGQNVMAKFIVKGGKLRVEGNNEKGEAGNEMDFGPHPDIMVKSPVNLVSKVIGSAGQISFNDSFIIMKQQGCVYLVGTAQEE